MEEVKDGDWLRQAIAAQGVTVYQAAKKAGMKRPDKLYHHIKGISFLNHVSLKPLAIAFPTMNMRYVLTGQGPAILPAQPPQPD